MASSLWNDRDFPILEEVVNREERVNVTVDALLETVRLERADAILGVRAPLRFRSWKRKRVAEQISRLQRLLSPSAFNACECSGNLPESPHRNSLPLSAEVGQMRRTSREAGCVQANPPKPA
jgi:hypothetical protein